MDFVAVNNVLRNVATLIEVQRNLPRPFNVFDLADVKHYETRHSAIIAGILGWSEKALCEFIKRFFHEDISNVPMKDTSVSTEYIIDIDGEQRRLDILIRVGQEVCVVIENKILTEDHSNQLEAYWEWLQRQCQQRKYLVYLTLSGSPSSENFPNDKYICLSYEKSIRDFLLYCATLTNMDTRFNSAVLQYAEFWENWFMQSDELTDKVCSEILNSEANYLAAEQVFLYFRTAKHRLIKRILQSWQNTKERNGFIPLGRAEELTGSSCDTFSFKWNDTYAIGFEFTNYFNDLHYGVFDNKEVNSRLPFLGWKCSPWWPAYKSLQSNERVRYLGDNGAICLTDQQAIFSALDSAFDETINLLSANPDVFGGMSQQKQ